MDTDVSDADVYQDLHMLLSLANTRTETVHMAHKSSHLRACHKQYCLDAAMDIPMQSQRFSSMEQAVRRILSVERLATTNNHLTGHYLYHLRLHAGITPCRTSLESPNQSAPEDRTLYIDGAWAYVCYPSVPSTPTMMYFTRADFSFHYSTAACCIVRTVMNWQNVSSDPTWASIDNWYWRTMEVTIGITAACIPALLPGYRFLKNSIKSYYSHRSKSGKSTGMALFNSDRLFRIPTEHKASDPPLPAKAMTMQQRPGLWAAANAASHEMDGANRNGGCDTMPLRPLPGDKGTMTGGIKKMMMFGVSSHDISHETRRSAAERDLERGRNDI